MEWNLEQRRKVAEVWKMQKPGCAPFGGRSFFYNSQASQRESLQLFIRVNPRDPWFRAFFGINAAKKRVQNTQKNRKNRLTNGIRSDSFVVL